jgi:hypothetical protein
MLNEPEFAHLKVLRCLSREDANNAFAQLAGEPGK